MTESPDTTTHTIVSPVATTEDDRGNNRLYRALAWVGIVAGILFIIAVVFFSGFFAARASGGDGWHRGWQSGQMQPGGMMGGGCPMMQMQPGMMGPGMMGPGMMGPGMMPGGMGPGSMRGPTSSPTTPTPPPAGQR